MEFHELGVNFVEVPVVVRMSGQEIQSPSARCRPRGDMTFIGRLSLEPKAPRLVVGFRPWAEGFERLPRAPARFWRLCSDQLPAPGELKSLWYCVAVQGAYG